MLWCRCRIFLSPYSIMKLELDTKQRINACIAFMLEFYKILMGTFLTVFVPHGCGYQKICTLSYNVRNVDPFHRMALGFNIFSFVTFLVMYGIELKRENWCITYLDMDPTKPIENLDVEIETYPVLKENMHRLNHRYKSLVVTCSVVQVANIAISVTDIGRYWAGMSSFTPLLGYILLIGMKMHKTRARATASLRSERAYSAFLSGPKTYNAIDRDHRDPEINTQIEGATSIHGISLQGVRSHIEV